MLSTTRKFVLIVVWVLAAIALVAADAFAQSRADIGAQISGASRALGYTGAAYGATGHLVTRKGRLGFEGQATWLHAAKAQTGDGQQMNGTAALRVYFGRAFVSGGITMGHQSTSAYAKSGGGPLVGVGWDDGITTVQVAYDHLFDENRSDQVSFHVERLARLNERVFISVRPFVSITSFASPHIVGAGRQNGFRAGITVAVGRRFRP